MVRRQAISIKDCRHRKKHDADTNTVCNHLILLDPLSEPLRESVYDVRRTKGLLMMFEQ